MNLKKLDSAVASWEELGKEAIRLGRFQEFKTEFLNYLEITNNALKKDLIAYANRLYGEAIAEMLITEKIRIRNEAQKRNEEEVS